MAYIFIYIRTRVHLKPPKGQDKLLQHKNKRIKSFIIIFKSRITELCENAHKKQNKLLNH